MSPSWSLWLRYWAPYGGGAASGGRRSALLSWFYGRLYLGPAQGPIEPWQTRPYDAIGLPLHTASNQVHYLPPILIYYEIYEIDGIYSGTTNGGDQVLISTVNIQIIVTLSFSYISIQSVLRPCLQHSEYIRRSAYHGNRR